MANNFDLQIKWINGSEIEVQATDAGSLAGTEKVLIMDGTSPKETTTQAIANLGGGGSPTIPATPYASNADAVAALGVGKLYLSVTEIGPEGSSSPVVLYTV